MVKREGVTSWVGGYVEGGTLGGGGVCWMLDTLRGYVGGGVCWMLDTMRGYVGGREYVGREEKRWVWDLDPGRPLKNRSKTAQKPLKSCLKNRSKIIARKERFLSGFLSKIWAVWAVFPKKNRPNRSNSSILAGKPLKPLKSWAVFERDLDPGNYRVRNEIYEPEIYAARQALVKLVYGKTSFKTLAWAGASSILEWLPSARLFEWLCICRKIKPQNANKA